MVKASDLTLLVVPLTLNASCISESPQLTCDEHPDSRVHLSEVYVSENSSWLEIYNPCQSPMDLSSTELVSRNHRAKIALKSIPAQSFLFVSTHQKLPLRMNDSLTFLVDGNVVETMSWSGINGDSIGSTSVNDRVVKMAYPTPGCENVPETDSNGFGERRIGLLF